MIKKTLRNYLSNLKFVFTPIGILTIFVLIGASIAITGSYNAVIKMFNDIGKTISTTDFNAKEGLKTIFNRFISVDWKDLDATLNQVLNKTWLIDTLKEAIKATFPNAEEVMSQLQGIITNCFTTISFFLLVIVLFAIIGIIVGYVVLKIFITRQTFKRKFAKAVLKSLLHAFINLLLIGLIIFALMKLRIPLVLNLIITSIIFFVANLFESYLIFGLKKLPFKKFFYWKDLLFVSLSGLIVIAITGALSVASFFVFRIITGLVLINGIVQVGLATNELLGESYVNYLIDKNKEPERIEEEASSKEE